MLLHCGQPAKLKVKKIVFEDIYVACVPTTLEQLKDDGGLILATSNKSFVYHAGLSSKQRWNVKALSLTRTKLLSALENISEYNPKALLKCLPPDAFYEEHAILYVVNWIKSNAVRGENLPLSIKSQAAKKSFPEVVSKENNIFGQKIVIPPVSTAKILQFHGALLECSPTIKPLFSVSTWRT
ncbi:hypothetical protein K1719_019112 [Acacia pycnantha]|nr:hypothetical protein K1719_019112 [Acacia pycnantha]